MKVILKYLSENWAPLLILIVALGVLAAIVTFILMKREKEKRDEEYAKMLCDVPIENVETDGVEKVEVRKERGNSEMDWLKGKIGKSGVLAADDIPEAVKAEVAVKEQKEREEQEAEEAAKKAEAVGGESKESEFEVISPKKKSVKPKAKKPDKTKTSKKNEDKAIADAKTEESADVTEEKKAMDKGRKSEWKVGPATMTTPAKARRRAGS